MIHMGGRTYEIVVDHRNAYNFEAFRDRYSEVLERYDYIVGDWGYNQLRLKGFFKENNQKSTRDTSVASLSDYLNEYCNFGCAYFVLERMITKNAPKLPQLVNDENPSPGQELTPTQDQPLEPAHNQTQSQTGRHGRSEHGPQGRHEQSNKSEHSNKHEHQGKPQHQGKREHPNRHEQHGRHDKSNKHEQQQAKQDQQQGKQDQQQAKQDSRKAEQA